MAAQQQSEIMCKCEKSVQRDLVQGLLDAQIEGVVALRKAFRPQLVDEPLVQTQLDSW